MNAVTPLEPTEIIEKLGPSRETILRFENHLKQFEPRDCPLKHTFAPGVYLREIFLPADTFIVGKIHKHAHHNVIVKGHCTVVTEFGLRDVDAREGHVSFVSEAGAKRALYVHEDTIWMTIHQTDSTDLAEIEREIIAPTYDELDTFLARARVMLERVSLRPGSQSPSLELEP
jgi:hypothetical protein